MDSTVMHINKGNALSWGNPKGTHTERKGNAVTRIKNNIYNYFNNSVIILTYGFDSAYQEILIDIANQNTTKYGVPANTSVGDIAVM